MKNKSGPRAWLVYVAVRSAVAVMQMFPINWNLRTACLIAYVWRWIMPRHFDRAFDNLTESYRGVRTPDELRRMAMRSLQGVVMFAVEVVCLPRLIRSSTWANYIRPVHFSEALEVLLSGRGAILVTGHYGPFELLGHLLTVLGIEVHAVMRPLDNVYLNRYIVSSRETHGLKLIDKKGATSDAVRLLSDGALLAFIGDQDAGRKGVFVDFFGRSASAYKSIGLLAMTTNVPIIVGYARRCDGVARYDVGVQRIIYPHEWEAQEDPLRFITQAYTTAIEESVRDDPEQYLWVHRRWKSQPRTNTTTGSQSVLTPRTRERRTLGPQTARTAGPPTLS